MEGYVEDLHSSEINNLFDTSSGILLNGADGRGQFKVSVDDIDTHNDRILLVEDSDGSENAGEDSQHLTLLLALLFKLLHMRRELVKQVVDNVRLEDLDADLIGVRFRLLVDLDVEAQHDSVLPGLFQHDTCAQNVFSEDRANGDGGNGNLGDAQELEKRFEGAEC